MVDKRLLNKKGKSLSTFSIVLIIFLIWIGVFLIISLIIIAKDPVSFSINLNKVQFDRGEELVLHYKISNNWPKEITNVIVKVGVQKKDHLSEIYSHNNSRIFKGGEGNYSLKINQNLPIGNYIIETNLTYISPNGKEQFKSLTLGFKVVT